MYAAVQSRIFLITLIILSWSIYLKKNQNNCYWLFINNQYLLCADNGLLNMILEEKPEMVIGIPLGKNGYQKHHLLRWSNGKSGQSTGAGRIHQKYRHPDVNYTEKNHLRPLLGQ